MSKIIFGTDGWRGVIAQDFTFENVEKIAYATAEYFKKHQKIKNGLAVGYDARFLSKEFADTVSVILANKGIRVILSNTLISTPMLATAILHFNAAGGIMITASHNPAIYNGFKLKADYGGPARREEITGIENFIAPIENNYFRLKKEFSIPFSSLLKKGIIQYFDFNKIYFENIKSKIDFELIKKSNLKILYDAMYGSGQNALDEFVNIEKIHDSFNPSFNNTNPEPLPQNCSDTIQKVISEKFDLALVTDGDADRFGAIDEKGNFISTQQLFPIFLKYLIENQKLSGEVVKTVSVTDIVDKICNRYNIFLYETPVGFKYITEYMINQNILIGGEESGGIGMNIHIPERDGIFNGLFLIKIMIERNKKLSELVEEIYAEYGKTYYDRIDFHTTTDKKEKIIHQCKVGLDFISGYKVDRVQKTDGFKHIFEDGWLLVRASGTEPVLRFYSESKTEEKVKKLLNAMVKL